ncbi:MAG: aldo/keto reductase, partial [Oscillospiraceae bacterium]|nr:aldo/keto reductase [Oscillospiraceae bacterium]
MKKLGFGLMRLPVINGDQKNIDIEKFKAMVDEFLSRGFTYFDTAYVYHGGQSEVAFKEAVVKRYPRDAYTVTTKLPLFEKPDRAKMEAIFNTSLERMGLD